MNSAQRYRMFPPYRYTTDVSNLKSTDRDFPGGAVVKNLPANAGDMVRTLVREDPTCRGATKPVRHNY